MYLFISENEVTAYSGEVLKRYIGKKLVKTISNPSVKELKEFGYMEMTEGERPTFDMDKECLGCEYEVLNGKIHCKFKVLSLPLFEEVGE